MKRPLSMTSFGRGEKTAGDTVWTVEIRSVNHRYCDISVRMPRQYLGLEERIKKEIATCFSRGRIDVIIGLAAGQAETVQLQTNLALAREYYNSLETLRQEFSLSEAADLQMVASFKDVITAVDRVEDLDAVWPPLREALSGALQGAMDMRWKEGEALKKDLVARVEEVSRTVTVIEDELPKLVEKREKTLQERLDKLLKGIDIDPMRLAQEVAILTDKSDVTEELVRLRSHIEQFVRFLEMDEPVGRRLDFLMQEFIREINTIASKISNAGVAHQTVDLKNEVEKLREQIQNLE